RGGRPNSLTLDVLALAAEEGQTLLIGRLLRTGRRIVVLHGPPALARRVGGRAMLKQAVEEEQAARLERRGHHLAVAPIGIADLPVAPLEVDHRPRTARPDAQAHAAVLRRRLVDGDPDADDRRLPGI